MAEELMNFDLPHNKASIIKVIGVGGGGNNAVNHMYRQGIKDVDFVVCNTDAQALLNSPVPVKIQIGESLTEGRGAGNKPEIGRQAALENIDDVMEALGSNTRMVFVTAGMGGGTGTGAAPVIAKATREAGILTVAIVTIPFRFEGHTRIQQAIEGINELRPHVDSLLVINNEKLREIYGDLKLSQAFARADDVLARAARGIAEIITVHGYINVDFADVETVMTNSGVAIMGSGIASGQDRAMKSIQEAVSSPLLNNNDITGARNVLLNITSGEDEISMDEVGEITDYVTASIDKQAQVIWGTCIDPSLGDAVQITIIATGFEANSIPELYVRKKPTDVVILEEKKNLAPGDETVFTIRDRKKGERPENMQRFTQRSIEFKYPAAGRKENNVRVVDDEEEIPGEVRKSAERIKKLKQSQSLLNDKNNPAGMQENIDELENEPAYIRKKIQLEKRESSESAKVSRYSLSEDEKEEIRLNPNNSYLHDNVD
ncbi:MAG: cell division protein FtsZ [Bacteroidales bacterium]